jgi:hypothetical protein
MIQPRHPNRTCVKFGLHLLTCFPFILITTLNKLNPILFSRFRKLKMSYFETSDYAAWHIPCYANNCVRKSIRMQNSEVVSALPSTTVKSTSIAGFGALVSVKILFWNDIVCLGNDHLIEFHLTFSVDRNFLLI